MYSIRDEKGKRNFYETHRFSRIMSYLRMQVEFNRGTFYSVYYKSENEPRFSRRFNVRPNGEIEIVK